ncbi:MAG: hypothetical protein IVW57_16340, partial [Ktedonobacterales bacterium]|nr:hypothetical protein [Ktedonobacterales bacterium]
MNETTTVGAHEAFRLGEGGHKKGLRSMRQALSRFLETRRYAVCAAAAILVGGALRGVVAALGWPPMNGDEGTTGITAMHIAYHGAHPVFFYGEDYMGALEAYLAAGAFRLFGVSTFSLRLGTILLFALFLICMYGLARLLFNRPVALLTVVLLSLGNADLVFREVIAAGGYPESLFFGSALFLFAGLAIRAYDSEAPHEHRFRRLGAYGAWGLAAGLGLWSDPILMPFVVCSGLWLAIACRRELRTWGAVVAPLGLLIGISPLIAHALMPPPAQGTSIALAQAGPLSGVLRGATIWLLGPSLVGTLTISLPRMTGAPPWLTTPALRAWPLASSPIMRDLLAAAPSVVWSAAVVALAFFAVRTASRRLRRLRLAAGGQPWPPSVRW